MDIIEQLKKQGMTKWRISKLVNVSWKTVRAWEKEHFKPTLEHLEKLKNLLNKKEK